jgi:hypothetical protein
MVSLHPSSSASDLEKLTAYRMTSTWNWSTIRISLENCNQLYTAGFAFGSWVTQPGKKFPSLLRLRKLHYRVQARFTSKPRFPKWSLLVRSSDSKPHMHFSLHPPVLMFPHLIQHYMITLIIFDKYKWWTCPLCNFFIPLFVLPLLPYSQIFFLEMFSNVQNP